MSLKQTRSLHVLVVDDESELRELIGEYLSARGHIVHVASDGLEAQACLSEEPIEVVLTDICMPNLDGGELVRIARERKHPIGVVVMTGFPTIESVTLTMKLGASDYLCKPFRLLEAHDALVKAATHGVRERLLARCQSTNRFYEAAHALASMDRFPTLMRLMMEAAQGEVGCEAACVWLQGLDGSWSKLAHNGEHADLEQVQPAVVESLCQAEDMILLPVTSNEFCYGVIALAGRPFSTPVRLDRLRHLTRAMGLAIGRVSV